MDEYSGKWPLWLDRLGQDTDGVFSVSETLAVRLRQWAEVFDTGFEVDVGWESEELAAQHEQEGKALADEVQRELGDQFHVELVLIR